MQLVMGIDEVGRGCWAGPLVAGAVILDPTFDVSKVRPWKLADSKVMTRAERLLADSHIRNQALAFGLGWVSAEEVDSLGLTQAVKLAMERAVAKISQTYHQIIIDGNYNFLPENPKASCLIKADATIPGVSAASILAKVARDTYMELLAQELPQYGFETNVGYGTKKHQQALCEFGVTQHHRKSYKPIKALL